MFLSANERCCRLPLGFDSNAPFPIRRSTASHVFQSGTGYLFHHFVWNRVAKSCLFSLEQGQVPRHTAAHPSPKLREYPPPPPTHTHTHIHRRGGGGGKSHKRVAAPRGAYMHDAAFAVACFRLSDFGKEENSRERRGVSPGSLFIAALFFFLCTVWEPQATFAEATNTAPGGPNPRRGIISAHRLVSPTRIGGRNKLRCYTAQAAFTAYLPYCQLQ